MAALGTHLGKHVHQVARAFREGGGVPYSEYRPEFTDVMDGISRVHLRRLARRRVPPAGARAARAARGGHPCRRRRVRHRPRARGAGAGVPGVDVRRLRPRRRRDRPSTGRGGGAQLTNVTFEVCDAARLDGRRPFDVVFVFDAVHDQVDPAGVLANIHRGARTRWRLLHEGAARRRRARGQPRQPDGAVAVRRAARCTA